jgi:hypothetical protein
MFPEFWPVMGFSALEFCSSKLQVTSLGFVPSAWKLRASRLKVVPGRVATGSQSLGEAPRAGSLLYSDP